MQEISRFSCIKCSKTYSINYLDFKCDCGGLLEVQHDWSLYSPIKDMEQYQKFPSGVWRFKPLIYPGLSDEKIIMRGEGLTRLYQSPEKIIKYTGSKKISFKHEGENPTGSFKDRGMTVGISEANNLKVTGVICASTGNTSASLAAYAAFAGFKSIVIIPKDKIAFGKLAQTIAYGAMVYQIKGNFDDSLELVQRVAKQNHLYLLNSINPWRIEGQKSIIFELLEQRNWNVPDWIVVPAGNLGNTSAFGKALKEAKELELINDIPHLVSVQAEGAQPFVRFWNSGKFIPEDEPDTLATAIRIGNPVSYYRSFQSLKFTKGLAIACSDQEIFDAKAIIDSAGIGCEPASASTLAGIKNLLDTGTILPSEEVIAVLTGHVLKDPQSILDYHQKSISSIKSNFANKIRSIDELEI